MSGAAGKKIADVKQGMEEHRLSRHGQVPRLLRRGSPRFRPHSPGLAATGFRDQRSKIVEKYRVPRWTVNLVDPYPREQKENHTALSPLPAASPPLGRHPLL